jgi:hypothetical protein
MLDEYTFVCDKCVDANHPEGKIPMSYSKYCDHISGKCPTCGLRCPFECDISKLFTE